MINFGIIELTSTVNSMMSPTRLPQWFCLIFSADMLDQADQAFSIFSFVMGMSRISHLHICKLSLRNLIYYDFGVIFINPYIHASIVIFLIFNN